jgi:RNA polymerase sigma factor (sigma-70 family)
MDISRGCKIVSGQATELAILVQRLHSLGHEKVAILIRLVASGLALKQATSLLVGDVLDGFDRGHEFDPYCRKVGLSDLRDDALRYARKCLPWYVDEFEHADPVFPSRKGGVPITTRTAERLLATAQSSMGMSTLITFRDVGVIGRGLKQALTELSKSRTSDRSFSNLLNKLRPEIRRRFPYNEDDQEDAEQAVLCELLKYNQYGGLDDGEAYVVATKVLADFRRRMSERRRFEIPGLLGDWSTVSNRHDAKFSFNRDVADGVVSVSDNELRLKLNAALDALPDKEREIMKLRWGLDERDRSVHTRAQLASRFKISSERVRQIEHESICRLREPWICRGLIGLLD